MNDVEHIANLENRVEKLERERDDLQELLKEIYVFIAMRHRACEPWREALDAWQSRVESKTEWKPFETIKKFKTK